MARKEGRVPKNTTIVTLKAVADHVGLTPGTVSAVLEQCALLPLDPPTHQEPHLAAARELNYRPNFFAQSLRKKRTYTMGLIVEEIGDAYGSLVISGVEQYLRQKNYFFLTVVHRHDPGLAHRYAQILTERGVEGFITVDMQLREAPPLPTVAVAGHSAFPWRDQHSSGPSPRRTCRASHICANWDTGKSHS